MVHCKIHRLARGDFLRPGYLLVADFVQRCTLQIGEAVPPVLVQLIARQVVLLALPQCRSDSVLALAVRYLPCPSCESAGACSCAPRDFTRGWRNWRPATSRHTSSPACSVNQQTDAMIRSTELIAANARKDHVRRKRYQEGSLQVKSHGKRKMWILQYREGGSKKYGLAPIFDTTS